jgi:hypothetical protein
MSWFSTNYEKVALGGAVALALGLAYAGWSKFGGVEVEFGAVLEGKGNNNAAVKDADLIPKAKTSLTLDRTWAQGLSGDRPVDLFTGIPLFVSSADAEKPIDLMTGDPVHPPISNVWWIQNRLDPGFADSPKRDPDQDGFSNLEEFKAKTDPNDSKSFPSLIGKLLYVRDESLGWVIRPTFGDGHGGFPFNFLDTKGATNKTPPGEMIIPNGLFFSKGVMSNRFKLLGSEVRNELSPKTNVPIETTYVKIEDQRANKKGTIYEYPAPMSPERVNEHLKYDRSAVFSLEALGFNGKEFKVEENTAFSIPPGGETKDYFAKTVTLDSVTVEYTTPTGEKKTVDIKKGNTPASAE